MSNEDDKQQQLTLGQVFSSVTSAFMGVQKNETRERDFQHGKPSQFIIVGLVLTVAFVLTIIGVVALVMHFAT